MAPPKRSAMPVPAQAGTTPSFQKDEHAAVDIGRILAGLIGGVLLIVFAFIGILVGAQVVATFLPDYFEAGADIVDAYNTGSIDNGGIGDTLKNSIGIIIPILVVVAPIGVIIGIFAFDALRRGGRIS